MDRNPGQRRARDSRQRGYAVGGRRDGVDHVSRETATGGGHAARGAESIRRRDGSVVRRPWRLGNLDGCGNLPPPRVGAWWLVLFNTGATKQYFAERESARESARPLSIGIIGWYLLIGAAGTALATVFRVAVLFGFILTGWSAVAVSMAYIAIQIYLGAGLLRLQERARLRSIVYFCALAANYLAAVARPGFMEQMQRAMPQLDKIWMFGLIGAAACAIPIWFLVRRRTAFPQA